MRMYTVYDQAAKEYGPPFVAKTDEVAIRQFRNMFQKMSHIIQDFSLFYCGDFSEDDGWLHPESPDKIDLPYEVEVPVNPKTTKSH